MCLNVLLLLQSMRRLVFFVLAIVVLGHVDCAAQSSAADENVSLQPGDLVRVQIWREMDLSGEFPVDHTGTVTLPLLGDRQVLGVPIRSLRDMLIRDYRVHLENPSISITPLRRINILGEVNNPGLYQVDPTISLAGAVALAAGATQEGDLRKIQVIRDGVVLRERVGPGESLTSADIRSGDQIIVDRRGWIERNSTFLISALLSMTSVITSIIISTQN